MAGGGEHYGAARHLLVEQEGVPNVKLTRNLTAKRYVGSVIVNKAASQFYEPAPGRHWTLGLRMVLPL